MQKAPVRPDRIIVGEVRGGEAIDLLQALNTGHRGSLCTIHANSAADALSRLETLALFGAPSLPLAAIRAQVRAAFDVVVQVERTADGNRRVSEIVEVVSDPGGWGAHVEPMMEPT
jgi:pilus assembly protein CpaF